MMKRDLEICLDIAAAGVFIIGGLAYLIRHTSKMDNTEEFINTIPTLLLGGVVLGYGGKKFVCSVIEGIRYAIKSS